MLKINDTKKQKLNSKQKHYKEIARLILKNIDTSLTEKEYETLNQWKNKSVRNQMLFDQISDPAYLKKFDEIDLKKEWQKLVEKYPDVIAKLKRKRLVKYVITVTISLFIIIAVIYFFMTHHH